MTTLRKILASIAGVIMMALVVGLAAPAQALSTPAQVSASVVHVGTTAVMTGLAPSCSGDSCSGQDPIATGCADGAYTIDSHIQGLGGGIVELRYSPKCMTNWARWTKYPTGWCLNCGIVELRAVQDTNYTQAKDVYNTPLKDGESVWTPMIFSPVRKVRAEIVNICGDSGLVAAAFDCLNAVESTRSL